MNFLLSSVKITKMSEPTNTNINVNVPDIPHIRNVNGPDQLNYIGDLRENFRYNNINIESLLENRRNINLPRRGIHMIDGAFGRQMMMFIIPFNMNNIPGRASSAEPGSPVSASVPETAPQAPSRPMHRRMVYDELLAGRPLDTGGDPIISRIFDNLFSQRSRTNEGIDDLDGFERFDSFSAYNHGIRDLEVCSCLHTLTEGEEFNCVICMEDFKVGDTVMKMICNHMFCETCAKNWFSICIRCPLCNIELEDNDAPDPYEDMPALTDIDSDDDLLPLIE